MSDQNANEQQVEFGIQRIYVKDISFESPEAPKVFTQQWSPKIDLNLGTSSSKVDADHYEVVLELTLTAKMEDKSVFIIELEQAGIFKIKGASEDQIGHMLGAFCPNLLFPYARELVDSLAAKGSFPPLMLAPINFDALYQQELAKKQNNS